MREKVALSDQLEERLVEFAAKSLAWLASFATHSRAGILPNRFSVRARRQLPIMRKRVHKMRIVQKELNETSVWLRVIMRCSLLSPELIVAIIAENKELSRIVTASIRTARSRSRG